MWMNVCHSFVLAIRLIRIHISKFISVNRTKVPHSHEQWDIFHSNRFVWTKHMSAALFFIPLAISLPLLFISSNGLCKICKNRLHKMVPIDRIACTLCDLKHSQFFSHFFSCSPFNFLDCLFVCVFESAFAKQFLLMTSYCPSLLTPYVWSWFFMFPIDRLIK